MHSTRIYQELRTISLAGCIVIALASIFFWRFSHTHVSPITYFCIANTLWLFSCWQTWKRADLNRLTLDATPFPNLGWANSLSLLRGGLIALTGGFLLQPTLAPFIAWLPGCIYGLAALLDRIDGFVARRTGRTSLLGSELDTLFDALGLLIAPLLAVQYGKIHWSFLAVSLAYYLFVFGLYWREKHRRPVYPLLPSQLRRAFAGFQMGFIALVLLPPFPANITQLLGIAFMLPILIGFYIDWLVVSGRIDGTKPSTLDSFSRIDQASKTILQPGLRVAIALLLIVIVQLPPYSDPTRIVFIGLLALLVVSGTGARLAALALLVLSSFLLRQDSLSWLQGMLLFATSWLLLLGPGNYCLWRGDDSWVNRKDGAQ